jgi:hypothetical protein
VVLNWLTLQCGLLTGGESGLTGLATGEAAFQMSRLEKWSRAQECRGVSSENSIDYGCLETDYLRGRLDERGLAGRLSDLWAAAYRSRTDGETELVEVDQGSMTYLFDIGASRVVAVYGKVAPNRLARPKARMRGFPLPPSAEDRLVRGHLVAHTLGGGTDINLIPQSASLNISAGWRRLERLAQTQPDAFVAVEVGYEDDSQTPSRFTYVVATAGTFTVESFANA